MNVNHRVKTFAGVLRKEFKHFCNVKSRSQMWISKICLMAAMNSRRHRIDPSAIAVPSKTREEFFRTAKQFRKAHEGILTAGKGYSMAHGVGRKYWLKPDVTKMVDEHLISECLKLSPLEDHNGRPLPEPANAIRSKDAKEQTRKTTGQLKTSIVEIDKAAVLDLYDQLGYWKIYWLDEDDPYIEFRLDKIDRVRRQCLAIVDLATIEGLPENCMHLTYHEADSGRIVGDWIHLQTVKRELKEAALNGRYDHDIAACHASFLLGLADQHGYKSESLRWYVENKTEFRQYLADEYGLRVCDVKEALAALMFGAPLSSSEFTAIGGDILYGKAEEFVHNIELKAINQEVKYIGRLVESQAPRSNRSVINILGKGIPETAGLHTKVAHILHGLETTALMIAIEVTGGEIELLSHDGFVTKQPVDTDEIADRFFKKTGIEIRYETERFLYVIA